MHIFIVQRIDLDFRSMRYIKIDIIIYYYATAFCATGYSRTDNSCGDSDSNHGSFLDGIIRIRIRIDGSTDRRCFAIVTNERALISRSDQPVRKVRQTPYCVFQAGKQMFKDLHNV